MGEHESIGQEQKSDIPHQKTIDAATQAAKIMSANLLRVIRGAGRPESIVHDAQNTVDTFTDAALASPNRAYPAYAAGNALRDAVQLDQQFNKPKDDAIECIVRGALQIAASRLVGQRTQERAGMRELLDGIRELNKCRNS